jgi:hypothetical protein
MIRTLRLCVAVCVVLIGFSCSAPPPAQSRLKADLYYLASPQLQGRGTRTEGDLAAQRYIGARYQQLGLEPWGQNKPGDFALRFPYGTNILGVLRGSDPKLADECVLVTAHHDHLGIQNGKIYPGACDNAAGVVAMLEIARQMATQSSRPRRSVCFLSTDAEEIALLGAVGFACDRNFDAKKIVANVNMDCLGRTSFEAIDDALILVGTENYPAVRQQVRGAALAENLNILPFGSDILGPRGDHIVFAELGIPSFFFTSGMYKDYHQPSDTPQRIDYNLLRRQTACIDRVVNYLANESDRPTKVVESAGDREELATSLAVVHILKRFGLFLGLPKSTRAALPGFITQIEQHIASPNYSMEDRQAFWDRIFPSFPPGLIQKPSTTMTPLVTVVIAGMKDLIKNAGSTTAPPFKQLHYGTRDRVIHFTSTGNDRYALSAAITVASMEIRYTDGYNWIHWDVSNYAHEGTRDQVIDQSLKDWSTKLDEPTWNECWQRILTKVAGESHGATYDEWVKWRGKPTNQPLAK